MLLAYTPFLDPLPVHNIWLWLIVPLILAVSLGYKTIKTHDLSNLPRDTASLATQILAFMAATAFAIWLAIELI